MGVPLRVLIVEDSKKDFLLLMEKLRSGGYDPVCEQVETAEAMSAALDRETWDAILIDCTLPRFNGIAALELIKRKSMDLPAIIVSGTIDDDTAVRAMKAGAHDYITKKNLARLIPAIEREMHEAKGRQERRRIGKALQETEKKFFTVFQHSPLPMAIASVEDGRLFDVNEQYTRLMEYSQEELIGHTTAELNLWADPEERKRYIQSIKKNHGSIQSYPVSVRTKSGNVIKVLFSADIIKINDTPYLLSSAVDITERLKAEEVLKTQAHILDRMAEGVNLADENGFITFTNPAYDAIFGYERGELIGKHVSILNVGSSVDNILLSNEIIQALKTIGIWSGEFANRKKDGTLLTTHAYISALEVSGKQFWVTVQEDITERKRSEEDLRESEERYRSLFEHSTDAILLTVPDVKIITANPAACRMFGYTEKELIGMGQADIADVEDPRLAAAVEERVRTGTFKGELTCLRKGKTRFPVELASTAFRDREGNVRTSMLIRDLSESKKMESALRESETRFRELFEHMYSGVAVYDAVNGGKDFLFKNINKACERISCITRDDVIGKSIQEIFPSAHRMGILNALARVWKTGRPEHLPIRKYQDQRISQWVENYIYKLPSGEIVAIYDDVTARLQLEDDLRKAEENFRHSLDDSPLGVRIATAEGETIYVNRAILDFYGYSSIEELRTMPLKELYTPESYAASRIRKEKRKQGANAPSKYEVSIVRKDGEVRHLQVFRKPTVWDREQQSQVIYEDITKRKQAVDALRHSQEQLRALAGRQQAAREEERTQVAREIHDDLGGALTAMKIDCSLLARMAAKVRDKALRDSLKARMAEMAKFIDATMRTVRRIATGLRPGVLDDLGLTAALEWQVIDFQKRTGIRCEFTSSNDSVDLDEIRTTALFRIAQEALTNVARHARATEVHIRLQGSASSILLEVKDNGVGIQEGELQSLKSLGILGMRERALSFGGRVTVTGKPGEGTTVVVESPPAEKRKLDREADR